MLKKQEILFKSGKILNAKMLKTLEEFSLQYIEIFYNNYSDGIITGLDFISSYGKLYITPGILKEKGEYFFLNEMVEIFDFDEIGGKRYIYLTVDDEIENDNIKIKNISINILTEDYCYNGIYLGEFKHHQGNQIKTDYRSYEDLDSEGDYINTIKRKYAGEEQPTINPIILYLFGMKKLSHIPQNYLESFIINNGLNKKIVNFNILQEYLGNYITIEDCYEQLKNKINQQLTKKQIIIEEEVEDKSEEETCGFCVE